MSARKRNHFIPRVLLNRFATRKQGAKRWIWQFQRDSEPREISTRDVAVRSYFYGRRDTGVEDAFVPLESRAGTFLRSIDGGEPVESWSEVAREFVYTLGVRTDALRAQVAEAGDRLLDQLAASTETSDAKRAARSALHARLDTRLEAEIDNFLGRVPEPFRALAAKRLQEPAVRAFVEAGVRKLADSVDLSAIYRAMLEAAKSEVDFYEAAEDGQITALQKLLRSAVPSSFCPEHWGVVSLAPGTFVLGDCCVFATSEDGETGSLLRFVRSLREIYAPISDSRVLVAKRTPGPSALDADAINSASARLSSAFILAADDSLRVVELSETIGSGTAVLGGAEIANVARNSWVGLEEGAVKETRSPVDSGRDSNVREDVRES